VGRPNSYEFGYSARSHSGRAGERESGRAVRPLCRANPRRRAGSPPHKNGDEFRLDARHRSFLPVRPADEAQANDRPFSGPEVRHDVRCRLAQKRPPATRIILSCRDGMSTAWGKRSCPKNADRHLTCVVLASHPPPIHQAMPAPQGQVSRRARAEFCLTPHSQRFRIEIL